MTLLSETTETTRVARWLLAGALLLAAPGCRDLHIHIHLERSTGPEAKQAATDDRQTGEQILEELIP